MDNTISALAPSSRIKSLDVAKGIGMLFVVFAHVNYTPTLLTLIYGFHMPLFFILSGILFNKEKYDTFSAFFKNRLKTLVCPYVLFYLVTLIYSFALSALDKGFSIKLVNRYISYFLQMFLAYGGSSNMVSAPLWFITSLLAIEFIYYYISKLGKLLNLAICIALSTLGWLLASNLLPFNGDFLPWNLDSALFALLFYALGNLFSQNIKSIIAKVSVAPKKTILCFLSMILSSAAYVPLTLYNGKISLGSKIFGNGFVLYLTGILGTIFILSLSVLLSNSRFLNYLGKNSFTLMASHYHIRITLVGVYQIMHIPAYDATSLKQTVIPYIIVLSASILFVLLYNKVKSIIIPKRI